jgi:hypothetical protein
MKDGRPSPTFREPSTNSETTTPTKKSPTSANPEDSVGDVGYYAYKEYGEEIISFHRTIEGARKALIAKCKRNHAEHDEPTDHMTPLFYCGVTLFDIQE